MGKYGFLIALGIASTAYHLWFTQLFPFEQDQHKIAHLGFMLVGAAVLAFEPVPGHDGSIRTCGLLIPLSRPSR